MPHRKLKDIVADKGCVTVLTGDTVADTVKRMQKVHARSALVYADDELKGIFTGSNLVEKVLDRGCDPNATPVGEAMTPDPFCLHCDQLGFDALREMRARNLRHIVVEHNDGEGHKVVSVRDFPNEEIGDYEDELAFEQQLWEEL